MRKFKIIGFIFIASILTCCGQPKEIKTECNTVEAIDGKDGVGIESIIKTSSNGNVDTYTITFTDNTSSTFTITNGKDGVQGIQGETGNDGYTPKVSIGKNGNWIIDEVDSGIRAEGIQGEQGEKGDKGNGIVKIELTKSDQNIDTYTIYFDDGTTTSFNVTNGLNGEQGLQGEAGQSGKSAYDIFKEYYPNYEGDEKQWIDDIVNGKFDKVNITFDANGGILDGPTNIQINKGEAIGDLMLVPKKKGKNFLGWYTGRSINDVRIDKTTIINSDLTIIAKRDRYDVEFIDFNGDVFHNTLVNHGSKVTKPREQPSYPGETFIDWDYNFENLVYSDLRINSVWSGTGTKKFGYYPKRSITEDRLLVRLKDFANGKVDGSILQTDYDGDGTLEKYFCENKEIYGGLAYFTYEPITRRIIGRTHDSIFIFPEQIIDANKRNDSPYISEDPFNYEEYEIENNYEKSSIRRWLNEDFMDLAFNEEEKTRIRKREIDNSAISTGFVPNEYSCKNTFDYAFLLSYRYAEMYTQEGCYDQLDCTPTQYALHHKLPYHMIGSTRLGYGWRTRSPTSKDYIGVINIYSGISAYFYGPLYISGVRPVLEITV